MANIKRFLTLILFSTLSALTMYSWGAEQIVSWSATTGALGTTIASVNGTATGTISTGSYSWNYTRTLVYLKSGKSDYVAFSSPDIQLGSSNAGETLNFTTSAIPGTIKSVTVGCWSKNGNHTLSITVGGDSYYSGATPTATGNTQSGTGTSSGTISIDFSISTANALYISSIEVVYDESGGGVTAPTFDQTAGADCSVTSKTVKVSNYDSGNSYYYTLDGTTPTSSSTAYNHTTGVTITGFKTLKMIAINGGNSSSVTTAQYVLLNTPATAYTVAEARTIIDEISPLPTCSVYVEGYVSAIVTAYDSGYKNLSFNVSDDGETSSDQFQFWRTGKDENCDVFTADPNVLVGNHVIGFGILKKYNSTYEFEQANCLILNEEHSACADPYTITLASSGSVTGGTFSSNKATACEDETVTLTATPATGYQLASWSVYKTGTPATTVTVTNNQFTMPAYGVTVSATFETLVINIVLSNKSNGHVQSCVNEGSATVSYDGTALTSFSPVSRDGFNAPTGYWTAASGGTMVLNADGSFAATNVTDYITNGHWSGTTTPIELLARISCSDTIRLTTAGANGSAALNRAKIPTCDCSDEGRRVTITATPNTGYEATSISYSGDGTATKVSGPTASGSNTVWIYEFDQNDNGSGTFTVTYGAIPSYTVTWNANGSESTTTVVKNNKPVFPSTPSACDATSTTFVGWSTSTWSGKLENLTGKTVYTSADDMPAVTGPVTYYAVWAKSGSGSGWAKVESIAAGDEVIFVYEDSKYELTAINTGANKPHGTATYYSSSPTGDFVLTVEEGASSGTFAFKNGDDYLKYSGSDNTLTTGTTKDASTSWTANVSSGDFTFQNCSTTTRLMKFNNTSGQYRWACYTSGQQAFQIYKQGGGYSDYITTCCTEVSRPEVTVAIHSTSVTLSWANQAGATYTITCSAGTVGSVTGDATKSCTITGLSSETEYTYSVTVSGATCSQTATGSFTTSNCDDVPVVGSVVATAFAVRFSWTNTSNNTTIKLYSDEECNTLVRTKATTYTTTAKTDSIAGLTNGTTYYYKLFSDGTCASLPGSFTTNENGINIAEWDTCAVYLDLGDMVSATAIVANQNTQAEITKHYADSLFFSKYFEADGTNKMIAIYNGTKDTLKLSDYRVDRSQKSSSSVITYKLKLDDYGRIKPGYICPEEEIIIVKYSSGDASAEECLEAGDGHENWYNESASSTAPTGYTAPATFLDFSGPMSIGLYSVRANKYIDVIGATMSADGTGNLVQIESSNSDVCSYARYTTELNDKPGGFYQLDGDNYKTEATENNYFLSTNRCLLIRNNKVKSGLNSVAKNVYSTQMECSEDIVKAFVTLSASEEEWRGFQIGSGSAGSGETHSLTCQGMAEVGKFDYNDYYAKYDTILTGINLTDQRQEDGTYKIEISQLDTMSCTNLKIVVEDNNTHEKVSGTWKVPIFVTNDGGTGHDGNVKTNDEVFTKEGGDCASCDVVVLKDANLQVVAGGKNQVRNIEVYNGAKLYVPEGQTFTINQLVLRSKDDTISRLDIRGTISQTADKFGFDKRIKATRWYKIALPYRCKISDVTFRNGEEATYGKDWVLRTYNGDRRANGTESGNWNNYTGEYMEAGVGYNLAINADILEPGNKYAELRFPMAPNAGFAEPASINVPVVAYGANNSRTKDGEPVTPNHLGWNMIGNPYMMDYKTGTNGANMSHFIAGKLDIVDEKYQLTPDGLRYVVKLNENSKEYEQIAIGDGTKNIEPFLAYFVQIGGTSDNQGLNVQFVKGQQEGRSSIIRRNPAEYDEVDNHPVWCVINLTNVLDEQDETTFLISDDFTDDYDMMDDLVKMRGDKYTKYTKPVLASRNNAGEMAFNALPDQSAAAGIPLNYFAAVDGDFTIALDGRFGIEELKDVQLYDSQEKKWIDLRMENNYPFYTTAGNNDSRFMLYVTIERKQPEVTTNIDNLTSNLTLTTIDRTLIVSGLTSNSDIYVYDVSGKLLNTERHSSSVSGIFRTTVEDPGVYFVRVNGTDGQQTLRTIVY